MSSKKQPDLGNQITRLIQVVKKIKSPQKRLILEVDAINESALKQIVDHLEHCVNLTKDEFCQCEEPDVYLDVESLENQPKKFCDKCNKAYEEEES